MSNKSAELQPLKLKKKTIFFYIWRDRWLYLMIIPAITYYFIFKYVPMYGLIIAFKDYNVFKGIHASKWVGLDNFVKVFSDTYFWKSIRNTIVLNLSTLFTNFPLTIAVSLLINEIRSAKFKKAAQSLLYLPHFISWVVVAGIAVKIFSYQNGSVNNMLNSLGIDSIHFLSDNGWWIYSLKTTIRKEEPMLSLPRLQHATRVIRTA